MKLDDLWKPVRIPVGSCAQWQVGPLEIWAERTEKDWRVTSRRDLVQEDRQNIFHEATPPHDMEWRRWVAEENQTQVQLAAVMPDRPTLARPESPVTMLPGQSAQFFIGVPLWVQLRVGARAESMLCELPTVVLSNSWFGTPQEGELCYAMRTTAKRQINELHLRPYRAVCPFEVRNASRQSLEIQRLCLRTQYLTVYLGRQHLWTNPGRVTHRGENEWSRAVYAKNPPDAAENPYPIGTPRHPPEKGILTRSFEGLKAFVEV